MRAFRSTRLVAAAVWLAFVALAGCTGSKPLAVVSATNQSPTERGSSAGTGNAGSRAPSGTKYIPRVSEKKLQQFMEGREPGDLTEVQVYAIMGEPTRRDSPITGEKNGQTYTVYKAYWEVPGSGVTSQIGFANGRCAGMILGLEIAPSGAADQKKRPR